MRFAPMLCAIVIRRLTLAAFAILVLANPVSAQFVSTASIEGAVTDESGAALPGVTVTLSSPALQTAQMAEATNGQGRYRFTNLPGGIYQVRFELAGFQTFLRGELQIGAGFAAKVDAVLKLGTLEETVTVSGASPVVDVTTTSGAQTLSPELVNQLIPGSRMYGDMARLVPGLVATSAPNLSLIHI